MAKWSDPKFRVLAIERMLSSGRKMSADEIRHELDRKYEICVGRRTIYDDIYVLSRFMPIESTTGHAGGFQMVDVLARCKD